MRGNIDEVNKALAEVREAKKISQQALAKLVEARQKVTGDVPELFKERETFNAQIRELIRSRNEIRDEFNKKNREYSAYMSEVRAVRGERARLERAQRQGEWAELRKQEADEEGPAALPFAEDLLYLDNLLKYCRSMLPKEAEKKEDAKALDVQESAGHMVLVAKDAREEEFFFAPTKRKQLKKKGGGAKAKPIVHSLETLSFLDKYKVAPPADASAIPEAMKAIEAKVAEFKKKQEKEIAAQKEKAEKKEEKKPADEEEKPADNTE